MFLIRVGGCSIYGREGINKLMALSLVSRPRPEAQVVGSLHSQLPLCLLDIPSQSPLLQMQKPHSPILTIGTELSKERNKVDDFISAACVLQPGLGTSCYMLSGPKHPEQKHYLEAYGTE